MSPKQAAISIILVSLAFAALILGTSYALRESSHRDTVTFCLIALWFIPYCIYFATLGSCCKRKKEMEKQATD